jgi:hypothetical protein
MPPPLAPNPSRNQHLSRRNSSRMPGTYKDSSVIDAQDTRSTLRASQTQSQRPALPPESDEEDDAPAMSQEEMELDRAQTLEAMKLRKPLTNRVSDLAGKTKGMAQPIPPRRL